MAILDAPKDVVALVEVKQLQNKIATMKKNLRNYQAMELIRVNAINDQIKKTKQEIKDK